MIAREFREAWRRLTRRPGYALLSIVVLGVGLGTAVSVFSVVNTLILQPYPFPHADRLMTVGEPYNDNNNIGGIDSDQYLALRGKLKSVDAIGAYTYTQVNLANGRGTGGTAYLASRMTASLGPVLGMQPLLGRDFTPADDAPGAEHVVMLDEALWRQAFHADPHIVGTSVKINGQFATVVGIVPNAFKFPPAVRLWLPLQLNVEQHRAVRTVARLAPGVALNQARAELDTLATPLARLLPPAQTATALAMEPVSFSFTPKDVRHSVWLMFGAGILVLLLACVNVANLQLVQTLRRGHELALRSALGSGRVRLMTGVLMESLVLSVAALAPAFALTWAGLRWWKATFIAHFPIMVPYVHGIDGWVVTFAVLVALFTTVVAGGVVAWRASRATLGDALRDGSKGTSGGFARVTKTLVVAEVALTVILLVGAGMFVSALDRLLARPTVGAAYASQVMTAQVSLPPQTYRDDAQRIRFYASVVERLQGEPGVVSAAASDTIPRATVDDEAYVGLPGHPKPLHGWPVAEVSVVSPHLLDTYGIRLLEGRFFDARDRATSAPVAVIDAKMAAVLWPHDPALQRKLVVDPGQPDARTVTVVGVVESLYVHNPHMTPIAGLLLPLDQAAGLPGLHGMGLALRMHAGVQGSAQRLAAAAHAVEPEAVVHEVRTQAQAIVVNRASIKVLTDAFGFLGLVALFLAAAGLYGVLAFSVAERTREIGIRRAIGAGSVAIARTVGKTLAWELGIGLGIGLMLAVPWSGMLADPALRTRAHDPAVFVPVLLIVMGVSVLAALVLLVRALRVDPAEALRYE